MGLADWPIHWGWFQIGRSIGGGVWEGVQGRFGIDVAPERDRLIDVVDVNSF